MTSKCKYPTNMNAAIARALEVGEIKAVSSKGGRFKAVKPFLVYKKTVNAAHSRYSITTLQIATDSIFVLGHNGRKYKGRVKDAQVMAIEDLNSGMSLQTARSTYDLEFEYRVGRKAVSINGFDLHPTGCSTGIHFFFTKELARQY